MGLWGFGLASLMQRRNGSFPCPPCSPSSPLCSVSAWNKCPETEERSGRGNKPWVCTRLTCRWVDAWIYSIPKSRQACFSLVWYLALHVLLSSRGRLHCAHISFPARFILVTLPIPTYLIGSRSVTFHVLVNKYHFPL